MQLKKYLTVALVAALLEVATPIILVTTGAAAATTALTLGVTVANPALAAVGGAAVLLGAAGLLGLKAASAGRRRYRYRGRRATEEVADDGYSVNAVEILFAAAGSLDKDTSCGMRLVCELAATPEQQLAPDEALLMSLFGSSPAFYQTSSPATPFQVAEFLGRQSASPASCARTYSKCKYNSSQIMNILRQNGLGQA